jgi:hypothetical protein
MIDSVQKYKGFYIGRYETGNLNGTTVVSKKGENDISSQTWYTMYKKLKALYGSESKVVSSIIWGSQYDQVMLWMKDIDNPNVAGSKYIYDSTGMGNYSGTKAATASNDSYKVKNIYDLAGNVTEYTMEAYSYSVRSARGGSYASTYNEPASNRQTTYYIGGSHSAFGTRLQLYIK